MSNMIPAYPGQNGGIGDVLANFPEIARGLITAIYPKKFIFQSMPGVILTETHSEGHVWFWNDTSRTEAVRHIDGTAIRGGQATINTRREIRAMADQMHNSYSIPRTQINFANPGRFQSELIRRESRKIEAIASWHEIECWTSLASGARKRDDQPNPGDPRTFPGGMREYQDGTTMAAAFPNSAIGASQFIGKLSGIYQKVVENFGPADPSKLYAFVPPYIHEVLKKDRAYSSMDYKGGADNSIITNSFGMAGGFQIVPSATLGQLTGSNVTGGKRIVAANSYNPNDTTMISDQFTSSYQRDFRKTAALICIAGEDAIGHISFYPSRIDNSPPEFDKNYQSLLSFAVSHTGAGPLAYQACGEIYYGDDDYTFDSNKNEFAPAA